MRSEAELAVADRQHEPTLVHRPLADERWGRRPHSPAQSSHHPRDL